VLENLNSSPASNSLSDTIMQTGLLKRKASSSPESHSDSHNWKRRRLSDDPLSESERGMIVVGPHSPGRVARESKPGLKQLTKLRAAILGKALYRSQGENWKSTRVPREQVVSFLTGKLTEQANRVPEEATFSYLDQHLVGSIPSSEQLDAIKASFDAEFNGTCRVSTTHFQVKLACSAIATTESDKKIRKVSVFCKFKATC